MLFSARKRDDLQSLNLTVGTEPLEQVSSYKYLGFILDEQLNMESHIENLCCNSHKKLGMLGRIHKYITRNTSLILYKSLLLPILDNGDIIYRVANVTYLSRVQRIQNSACRIVLMAPK